MTDTRKPARRAVPAAVSNASSLIAAVRAKIRAFGTLRLAVLALGLTAGLLMLIAELSTIWSVDVVTASCSDLADPSLADACVRKGYEAHLFALIVLGLLVLVMTWGAARGASRPAALALVAIGAVVLAIALIGDASKVDETGRIGQNFDEAEANPGAGFYLEIAGGILAVLAGGLALRLGARPSGARRRPEQPERASEAPP
jgi:hypothetical protein